MLSRFESFLMEKHAEQYIGTDDGMTDHFEDWLQDLDIETLIEYADKFSTQESKQILELVKILLKILPENNINFPTEEYKNIIKEAKQVISKAEGEK